MDKYDEPDKSHVKVEIGGPGSNEISSKCDVREGISETASSRVFNVNMVENNDALKRSLHESYLIMRCGKLIDNLQYMDLTGKIIEARMCRRLVDGDLPIICTYLKAHPNVVYLNLSYNSISADGFVFLAQYLAEDQNLKTLNLMQNDITEINEVVLRKTASLWSLKCLILTGNKIGKEGGIAIANMLHYNSSIAHLDLGETDQNIESVSYIIESLLPYIHGHCSVKKLDLSRIIPSSYKNLDSSHLCRLLSHVLIHNQVLIEIHLPKNCITDFDIEIFFDALRKNKVLETLNLSANKLTCHGLEQLSSILPETNITNLMISSNRISDGGAVSLGRVFSKTNLQFLDISFNQIKDVGFVNLIWGMRAKNPPVHTFFFYGNPISPETADIVHKQVFLKHISPIAMDVQFVWKRNKMFLTEDKTANKYRNLRYFVYEPNTHRRPLHHSCCYQTGKKANLPYKFMTVTNSNAFL